MEATIYHTNSLPTETIHELESGEYTFSYMPNKPHKFTYEIDTSIQEIYKNDEAREIVESYLPNITKSMLFTMFAGQRSVLDFIKQGLVSMTETEQAELDQKLRDISDF